MPKGPGKGEYTRPEGFHFDFHGMNIKEQPDALAPTQFTSAVNIRADCKEIRTRPGYELYALLYGVGSFCVLVQASIDPDTLMVTGSGEGEHATQWQVIRISDGTVMDSGAGTLASFSFLGEYETDYQLQFR